MTRISGDYDVDPEDYELDEVAQVFAYIAEISLETQVRDNRDAETGGLRDQIDNTTLYLGSADFFNLLSFIDCEFDFKELFTEPNKMPTVLAKKGVEGYNSKITYENTLRNNPLIRLCGLTGLLFFYYRIDASDSLQQTFENNIDVFDSDRDGYLLDLFRSYIGYTVASDRRYGELSEPIERAYQAHQSGPDHYLFQTNLAEAIVRACELRFDYQPDITGLPHNRDELLERAVKEATEAKQVQPEFTRIHTTLARGNALLGHFDPAWENLSEAIVTKNSSRTETYLTESRLEELQRNINSRYQAHNLEQQVEDASENLNEIQEDFSSLESNLETVIDRYRKNNLSFIGFFAALITLVVASVEIIGSTSGGVQESGQLIMMLTGGMLIAFGGFGLIIHGVSDGSESYVSQLIRTIAIALLGAVLLMVGYHLPF